MFAAVDFPPVFFRMSFGGAFPLTKARVGEGREGRRRTGTRAEEVVDRNACRV
jgi:hypothetical protein